MTRLLLFAFIFYATFAQADENRWSTLWQSADQRAERLLKQGNAAAAARTYDDPRRKAYAKLKAGDYPAAAQDFAAFDDSDAHYNRGNALVHSGDLQAALKAYDTALARDPHNQDARHNRDLVTQALQKKPPQSSPQQSQQSSPRQENPSSERKSSPQQGTNASSQEKRNEEMKNQQEAKNSGTKSPPPNSAQPSQANPKNSHANPSHPDDSRKDSSHNEAAQARHDAAAGLNKKSAEKNAAPSSSMNAEIPNGKHSAPTAESTSEQRLSQEQWLRYIPDDPGGLLRRKFMIEHMMRHQEAEQ